MSLVSDLVQMGNDISAIAGNKTFCAAAYNYGAFIGSLIGGSSNNLKELMNAINDQPSVCYVPIQSESLSMRRQVDIGNTMLISQVNNTKDYVTDNAAPRPRVWTIRGYLRSLAPMTESGMVIKPSLQMQKSLLEQASESRQSVPFKSDDGEVVDVLIQDLQIGSIPKGNGVRTIDITVQEVKVLKNTVLNGTALGNVASNSVLVNSVLNLGKNNVILNGVSRGAASFLLNI